jgi:ribonuclease D
MTLRQQAPRIAPGKEEIALLPPFEGLPLARIHVPATRAEFEAAARAIRAAGVVGFDTESKPLFDVGAVSDGPHVVQFATATDAWLFQSHREVGRPVTAELLASEDVLKAGFGLSSDFKHIRAKLGIEPRAVVDIDDLFRARGYRKSMGVRAAVALLFDRRLQKSKRQTTSNWARAVLDDKQRLYAANDAYAAFCVHAMLVTMPMPATTTRPERSTIEETTTP